MKEFCVCVCGGGGGFRSAWTMLVFISTNRRNFYSRFYVQQNIIADFFCKSFTCFTSYGVSRNNLQSTSLRTITVVSPFTNQHMCTTLCISNHISVTAPTCFSVFTSSPGRPESLLILRNTSNDYGTPQIVPP